MDKRTAREILIKDELLSNKNINVKIGTVENRDSPQTVYINMSFWIKPIISSKEGLKENLEKKLNTILNNNLVAILNKNHYFPFEKRNNYICNIPENFNYNDKSNFISLEIYLHTININSEKKYPLSVKKDTELFRECVRICNFIGEKILKIEKTFYIDKNIKAKKTLKFV